jgi:SRSO17 transposase
MHYMNIKIISAEQAYGEVSVEFHSFLTLSGQLYALGALPRKRSVSPARRLGWRQSLSGICGEQKNL